MQLTLFALLPLLALPFSSASPVPSPDPAPATKDIASTLHDHLVAGSSTDSTTSPAHLVARGPLTHTGVKIVSNKSGKCLSIDYRSRYPNNGDLISLVDCRSTKLWDIYQDGSVVMHDFNNMPGVASGYAIDAGTNPSNGGRLKVSLFGLLHSLVPEPDCIGSDCSGVLP